MVIVGEMTNGGKEKALLRNNGRFDAKKKGSNRPM